MLQARTLLSWTTLAALVIGTAGCDLVREGDDELPQGFVAMAVSEPEDLLPSDVRDAGSSQILAALFTPLVGYDAERRPVQAAAQSITSTDNRVWTITLAPGYTFHNGEPVTAQSYLDAWNYAAYGPHQQRNGYLFERIEGFAEMQGTTPTATTLTGLQLVDPTTFTVTLGTPFVDFRAMLGHPAFSPLPKAAFGSPNELAAGFDNAVIGQGPFRLTGPRTPGQPIDVRRHDAAVVKAKVNGVRFLVYRDISQAYDDLADGGVDVAPGIPDAKLPEAARQLGDRLLTAPSSTMTMLAFPASERALSKPAVRRAISMAIDRDQLVESLFPGAELPARSFVAPPVVGYRAQGCAASCTFDPAAAKSAYQEAGGPPTLRVSYNNDGGHQRWVDATCQQLTANLGVDCTGAAEPTFEAVLDKVRATQPVGMFRMTWFMDYPSMDSYLRPLFTSDGASNFHRYQNSEFDDTVRDAAAAKTSEAAVTAYQRAEAILARDMPVIPLRFEQTVVGRSERVPAVSLDAFNRVDLSTIERR